MKYRGKIQWMFVENISELVSVSSNLVIQVLSSGYCASEVASQVEAGNNWITADWWLTNSTCIYYWHQLATIRLSPTTIYYTPLINRLWDWELLLYARKFLTIKRSKNLSFDLDLACFITRLIKFDYYKNQVFLICNELSKVLLAYIHSFDRGRELLNAEYISKISLDFLLLIDVSTSQSPE